jgi:hypothetical protein
VRGATSAASPPERALPSSSPTDTGSGRGSAACVDAPARREPGHRDRMVGVRSDVHHPARRCHFDASSRRRRRVEGPRKWGAPRTAPPGGRIPRVAPGARRRACSRGTRGRL